MCPACPSITGLFFSPAFPCSTCLVMYLSLYCFADALMRDNNTPAHCHGVIEALLVAWHISGEQLHHEVEPLRRVNEPRVREGIMSWLRYCGGCGPWSDLLCLLLIIHTGADVRGRCGKVRMPVREHCWLRLNPQMLRLETISAGIFFLNISQLLPLEEDYKNYTLIIQFEFLEFTGSEIV